MRGLAVFKTWPDEELFYPRVSDTQEIGGSRFHALTKTRFGPEAVMGNILLNYEALAQPGLSLYPFVSVSPLSLSFSLSLSQTDGQYPV